MLIEVRDASHAGEARRLAMVCAEEIALDESARGALAIVVTAERGRLFTPHHKPI